MTVLVHIFGVDNFSDAVDCMTTCDCYRARLLIVCRICLHCDLLTLNYRICTGSVSSIVHFMCVPLSLCLRAVGVCMMDSVLC